VEHSDAIGGDATQCEVKVGDGMRWEHYSMRYHAIRDDAIQCEDTTQRSSVTQFRAVRRHARGPNARICSSNEYWQCEPGCKVNQEILVELVGDEPNEISPRRQDEEIRQDETRRGAEKK
jgi:hypothetical protein